MNWKILGKALLKTIGLLAAITLMILIVSRLPIWLDGVILLLAIVVYAIMKTYDDMCETQEDETDTP